MEQIELNKDYLKDKQTYVTYIVIDGPLPAKFKIPKDLNTKEVSLI